MKLVIPRSKIDNLFKIDLSKLYFIEKQKISEVCLYIGMLILYFGSLHPWFLWPLKELYPIPAVCLLLVSYLLANSAQSGMYCRNGYLKGLMCYIVLSFYIIINGGQNVNAYIINCFSVFSVFILFKTELKTLDRVMTFIAKVFALLLLVSMFFFVAYLVGVGLPYRDTVFGDNLYSFSNYYFFMVDDRSLLAIIPRFQSVFLEPGHLGSAASVLLMTQIGRWKRWWNVTLMVACVISFSLAAYAIIIALSFLNLWVQRKNLIGKFLVVTALMGSVAVSATFYNGGDNLINNLILARLEIDEKTGDIVGNNRVDVNFEKEFDKFIATSDAFFGRDMDKIAAGSGNSGYRVFIYKHGLVGMCLVILFYGFMFTDYRDIRHLLMCICISLLIFWIRGYPLWHSNFIPIFAAVGIGSGAKVTKSSTLKRQHKDS